MPAGQPVVPMFLNQERVGARKRASSRRTFPGDPGEGKFFIGVADGPRDLTTETGVNVSQIAAGTSWAGRPVGLYMTYSTATRGMLQESKIDEAINANCIAMQSFKFDGWTHAQIVAGAADADLLTMANMLKSKAPHPVWVTHLHEPENNVTTTATQAAYRDAMRYMVQFFRDEEVTNVAWMIIYQCPYTFRASSGRDWRNYHPDWNGTNGPGGWHDDRMMDMFGVNIYNANINQTAYEDIDDIMGDTIDEIVADGFGKIPPFVMSEFGMAHDTVPYPVWDTSYCLEVRNWCLGARRISGITTEVAGIVYWNHNTSFTPSRYEFFPTAADPDGSKLRGWRLIGSAASTFVPPAG